MHPKLNIIRLFKGKIRSQDGPQIRYLDVFKMSRAYFFLISHKELDELKTTLCTETLQMRKN